MIYQVRNLFAYLFFLIPIFLITGPAVPDITITFGCIFGLCLLFFKNRNDLINNNLVILSLFFWFTLIFISCFAINKAESFQDSIIFLRYLAIPICCYFLFFRENKFFYNFLFIVLIIVIFVCIDTLFQFFNYDSQNGFGKDLLGFESNWYGRLTGPFGEELIPGSYVSKFGLIGYAYLLINKKLRNKILLHSIYLSVILIVCFASGERMALATYSLGLIILFIFLRDLRLVFIVTLIIAFISIFSIYKTHPFYNDYEIIESTEYHQGLKIKKSFECESEPNKTCYKTIKIQPGFFKIISNFSTSAYGEIYILAYKMFKDNPITGVGINNYKYLCENKAMYKQMMINYDCASHPHNTYIQWLSEGGIIVFISFIIYLISILKLITKNQANYELRVLSLVLLLILFWPIMSTGSLIKNWYGITVFFIIGVSLCLSRFKKDF